MDRCETCRFWKRNENEHLPQWGDCRRYAPGHTPWTQTRQDDWCGDYQSRHREEPR